MGKGSILLRLKTILETMCQPHYGDMDTKLDNYFDAQLELRALIIQLEDEEE